MIYEPLPLEGAFLIVPELITDDRGFFARILCAADFTARGLEAPFVQASVSYNHRAGTLRGLHWQDAPFAEVKVVRCTRGRIFDVIVDLRPGSPTYRRWTAVDLSERNRRTIYIPKGFAHGFQTLEDGCEVAYEMTVPYAPQAARGARWNDPAFGIDWPQAEPRILSVRDASYPDFLE